MTAPLRPEYCLANDDDESEPCACGATQSGNDPVRGVCQAYYPWPRPSNYGLRIILVDRDTGEPIT